MPRCVVISSVAFVFGPLDGQRKPEYSETVPDGVWIHSGPLPLPDDGVNRKANLMEAHGHSEFA